MSKAAVAGVVVSLICVVAATCVYLSAQRRVHWSDDGRFNSPFGLGDPSGVYACARHVLGVPVWDRSPVGFRLDWAGLECASLDGKRNVWMLCERFRSVANSSVGQFSVFQRASPAKGTPAQTWNEILMLQDNSFVTEGQAERVASRIVLIRRFGKVDLLVTSYDLNWSRLNSVMSDCGVTYRTSDFPDPQR